MKVFQWQADTSGTGFYRMVIPGQALALRGHTIVRDAHMAPSFVAGAEVIVGQRVANPGPTALWSQIAAETEFKLVYDADDDYTNIDPSDRIAYDFFMSPNVQGNIVECISKAHRVTVASKRLAEIMSQWNEDVVLVPNSLPANLLTWNPKRKRETDDTSDKFVIGIVMTSSTLADGALWLDIAYNYISKHRDANRFVLHIIGPDWRQLQRIGFTPSKAFGRPIVKVTPFIQGTIPYLRAVDFDVWLAPYRDTPFNDAKFPTKALEAAFLGIPLIATGIRPYREWHDDNNGRGIILPSRPTQLPSILTSLVAGTMRRRAMSRDARRVAVENIAEYRALAWESALSEWDDR